MRGEGSRGSQHGQSGLRPAEKRAAPATLAALGAPPGLAFSIRSAASLRLSGLCRERANGCSTPSSPTLDSDVLLERRTRTAQPVCHLFCMLPPAGSGRSAPNSIFFFFLDVRELLLRFGEQMMLFFTIAEVSCHLHGVWKSSASPLPCAEERYLVGPVVFL